MYCISGPPNGSHPTLQKPLVLFTDYDFKGSFLLQTSNVSVIFANNDNGARNYVYKSMRIYPNRQVVFTRNVDYDISWSSAVDISNITELMVSNGDIANPIWFNYDVSYGAQFGVKVVGNAICDNCTDNGSCYTGSCLCYPGYTGSNCETSI